MALKWIGTVGPLFVPGRHPEMGVLGSDLRPRAFSTHIVGTVAHARVAPSGRLRLGSDPSNCPLESNIAPEGTLPEPLISGAVWRQDGKRPPLFAAKTMKNPDALTLRGTVRGSDEPMPFWNIFQAAFLKLQGSINWCGIWNSTKPSTFKIVARLSTTGRWIVVFRSQ